MSGVTFYSIFKLSVLYIITLLLSGCYSLDQKEFCIFGKDSYEDTDFSSPVIVSVDDNKISKKEQNVLLKSSHAFSSEVINETYDSAEYLCKNEGLTTTQYQKLHNVAYIYVGSGAVYPLEWTDNGKVQREKLHQALIENDSGRIVTGAICVVGLCNRVEHEAFCENKKRTYLKDKKLIDALNNYYLARKGYKVVYPSVKSVSYCKGPRW